MKEENKLLYIEWEDSAGSLGRWTDIDDMKPDQPIHKSVGWLMYDTDRWIVLVPHLSSEPDHPKVLFTGQGQMTIPKSAILKQQEISL